MWTTDVFIDTTNCFLKVQKEKKTQTIIIVDFIFSPNFIDLFVTLLDSEVSVHLNQASFNSFYSIWKLQHSYYSLQ